MPGSILTQPNPLAPDPTVRDKFERFVKSGGQLDSVPPDVWGQVGGAPLREKLTRFDAAGGQRASFALGAPTQFNLDEQASPMPDAGADEAKGPARDAASQAFMGGMAPEARQEYEYDRTHGMGEWRRLRGVVGVANEATPANRLDAALGAAPGEFVKDYAGNVVDPLEQAAKKGTAWGWARGVGHAALGALADVTGATPLQTGIRNAREVVKEQGRDSPLYSVGAGAAMNWMPLLPNTGFIPMGAFDAYGKLIQPLDKIAADERRIKAAGGQTPTWWDAETMGEMSAFAAEAAPLALAHGVGEHVAQSTMGPTDAAALAARDRVTVPVDPSLANAPKLEGAGYAPVDRPNWVRAEPDLAGLPAPEPTPLAPYRGGPGVMVPPNSRGPNGELIPPAPPPEESVQALPAGAPPPQALPAPGQTAPWLGTMLTPAEARAAIEQATEVRRGPGGVLPEQRLLPDPNEFGRNPGVLLPPEEAAAARAAVTPKPILALPENAGPTNYQGVLVPTAERQPPTAPVSATLDVAPRKRTAGTPTDSTGAEPGEGVTPSGRVPPPPPPTTPIGTEGGVPTARFGSRAKPSLATEPEIGTKGAALAGRRFGARQPETAAPPAPAGQVSGSVVDASEPAKGTSSTTPTEAPPVVEGAPAASPPSTNETSTPQRFGTKGAEPAAASGLTAEKLVHSTEGTFRGPLDELRMKTEDVNVDAKRFQHKEADAKGLTERLKKAKAWEEPTEPLSVWRDPADGKVYVVNGHQRIGLAKRVSQPDVPVKFIDAPNAEAARLEGAKENLRSGHAAPVDVARFFRELKADPDAADKFLESIGATDTAPGIREGRALAALPDVTWDQYRRGPSVLRENRAVAIGEAIRENKLTEDQQFAFLDESKKTKDGDLSALARQVRLAGMSDAPVELDMFGEPVKAPKSLVQLQARLQSGLLDTLAEDNRTVGSTVRNAEALKAKGVADVDTAKGTELVETSKTLFGQAKNLLAGEGRTPLDDFVSQAARDADSGRVTEEAAKTELVGRVKAWLEADPFTKKKLEKIKPGTAPDGMFGGQEPPPEPPTKPKKFGNRGETGAVGAIRPGGGPPKEPISTIAKGIDQPYAAAVDVAGKVALKVPGVKQAVRIYSWARDKFFTPPAEQIGKEFGKTVEAGRGEARVGQAEATYFHDLMNKQLGEVPDASRGEVYSYLGGERDALPAGLSKEATATIERVRDYIDHLRTELVNRGRLSPEAYDEFGRYLTRQMQNVELGKQAKTGQPVTAGTRPRLDERWTRQDSHEVRIDLSRADAQGFLDDFAEHNIRSVDPSYIGERKGTTLVKFPDSAEGMKTRDAFAKWVKDRHAQARSELNTASTKEFASRANQSIGQGKMLHKGSLEVPKAADLNIKTYDPLTPEMRDLMGEVTDPAQAVGLTVAKIQREIATHDMLQAIVEGGKADPKGEWVKLLGPDDKTSEPPDGYTYVNNKRMGPVNEAFVRNDIAKDLAGEYGTKDLEGQRWDQNALDFAKGATDGWKVWRTIRNPAGHAQNIISAPVTSMEAGVSILNPENWKHYEATLEALKNPDPFESMQREIIKHGIDEGAHLSTYELGKIRDAWNDPNTSRAYKLGKLLTDPAALSQKMQNADLKLGRAYNFADRLIRQSAYRKLRAEGLSPEAATVEVDKFTTNYAKQGEFVKQMRHLPFSPFLTYAYERLRILKNNLAEHPTRAAVTIGGAYALQQILEHTMGSDVSDEEKKGAHAEYGGSRFGAFGNQNQIVTGRNDDGSPRVWDTSSLFTADRLIKGPKDVLDEGAVESTAKWLLGDVLGMSSGPVYTEAMAQATGRDTMTGKEMLTGGDRAEHALTTLAPPFLPRFGAKAKKIEASAKGEPYAKTKPAVSLKDALLDSLLHIRVDGYVPEQSLQNLLWQLGRGKTDAAKVFKERLNDAARKGDDAKAEAAGEEYGAKLEPLFQRFGAAAKVHEDASEKTPAPAGEKK